MQVWMTLLLVVQLLAALTMIGLVLVQHGKGADMGASFGGGASGSLFGATGSANFLSRSTAVCASVFFVATLALAFMADVRPVASGGSSVLDQAAPGPPLGAFDRARLMGEVVVEGGELVEGEHHVGAELVLDRDADLGSDQHRLGLGGSGRLCDVQRAAQLPHRDDRLCGLARRVAGRSPPAHRCMRNR